MNSIHLTIHLNIEKNKLLLFKPSLALTAHSKVIVIILLPVGIRSAHPSPCCC